MAETVTIDRLSTKLATVSALALALHLDCSRTYIAKLEAEGVIERRADGLSDQNVSRLKYIKHLHSEHRDSPRMQADADHVKVKTEMLQMRLMEKKRELVKMDDDVSAMIDDIAGVTLTALSSLPARCALRGDLAIRRSIERACTESEPRSPDQMDAGHNNRCPTNWRIKTGPSPSRYQDAIGWNT